MYRCLFGNLLIFFLKSLPVRDAVGEIKGGFIHIYDLYLQEQFTHH